MTEGVGDAERGRDAIIIVSVLFEVLIAKRSVELRVKR